MKRSFSLLACALLVGCNAMPYRPAQSDGAFPGLVDFAATAPGHSVDVLLVHGMCTHDVRWADETVAQLGSALKTQGAPTAGVATAADGIEIVERTIKLRQGELRIKALVWSPLTTPLKRQLDYDLSARLPATRAKLNAKAKDKLLDDCLPDALVYQGVARDTIQQRMAQAILRATGDAPCEFNAAQKQRRQIEPGGIQRPERPADLYAGTRTLCRPGSGCGECAGIERAGLVWPAGAS